MESNDLLDLLASLGQHEDYDPPSVRLADELGALDDDGGTPGGGDRMAQIIAAADAAGGEVS
jgi:hypothetical protein